MGSLTFKEIISAARGRLLYGEPNGVHGVSIDSRTIKEGELFVALKGSHFDGHDFVSEALERGCGAIVSVPPSLPPKGKVVVYVENTLKALQDIAHYLRMKNRIPVVGITGTNGKTTTKEMTASILGTEMGVLKNTGNLNNQIGLPLSLLGLSDEHQAAVLEMGASCPGDIRELCEIASPDYGVLTNIGHAHIEGFNDIEAVRRTKLEILDFVKTVVVNADDAFLMEGIRHYARRIVTYGMSDTHDVFASDIKLGEREATFALHLGGKSGKIRLKVTGMFNIYNALAAASVATLFNMSVDKIREGLEAFEGVPMRLEMKELSGATVISDVYNANPASMEEALRELVRLRRKRAVAVLGDMLELGSYAETAHRKLGKWMAGLPVDLFIAVGPFMSMAAEEFTRLCGEAITARDSISARQILLDNYTSDDTILIKGSRSMRMERVVDPLQRNEKTVLPDSGNLSDTNHGTVLPREMMSFFRREGFNAV